MNATYAARVEYCRENFGFWLAPGPGGRLYVYVPAGSDPADGAALTAAHLASETVVALWERGKYARIARILRALGAPVKEPRSWWKRILGRG